MSQQGKLQHPGVTIIVLNWNGLADTVECIESLRELVYPNYSLVVVDNASKGDDVQQLEENYGDSLHIIRNDRNYGFAEGNNIGIRYALSTGTDYILLLNNDTVVDPHFLTELIIVAENDPAIAILGPKIYCYDAPRTIWPSAGTISRWSGYELPVCQGDDPGQVAGGAAVAVEFVSGCALLAKRHVFEQIGLLDTRFPLGYEDYLLCALARRQGSSVVYVPSAVIRHKIGASRRRAAVGREEGQVSPEVRFFQIARHFAFLDSLGPSSSSVQRLAQRAYYLCVRLPRQLVAFLIDYGPVSLVKELSGEIGGMLRE